LGKSLYLIERMDEDPVDPKPQIEEKCKPKCANQWGLYQGCVERLAKLPPGSEKTCIGTYYDYQACLDKCVMPKLFHMLK